MKKQLAALTILLALAALPALGQTAAKPAAAATGSTDSATSGKSTAAAADKIDINSASKEELMKVEGIGDAISDKIVAGRPYKSKRDLLTRKIVNQATYANISDKIVAHAAKAK